MHIDDELLKDVVVDEIKRHKLYRHTKNKIPSKKERSTNVKVLSNEEIRQTKGLGAKPLISKTDNILWTIINKGPISSREIKDYLDKETGADTNSASMLTVLSSLKDMPGIKRERVAGCYKYSTSLSLSLEDMKAWLYKKMYGNRKKSTQLKLEEAKCETLSHASSSDASALIKRLFDGLTLEITFKIKEAK